MNKFLLICFALMISLCGVAQTNGDWTELGPKDFPPHINWQLSGVARISQMKFHPTDPNILYAVNAMGGIFISKDKGANWLKTGADNLPQTRCASLCIDNANDQILYLGTGDPSYYSNGYGIWKSTNGGYTWAQSNNGIGNRMAVEILMPGNSGELIAATNDGIWKSTDGGANWAVKKSGGQFTDMVFQANSNDVMFACTYNEFWRSTNKGETWTRITLPGNGISGGGRVAVSKANGNVVYVSFVGDFNSGNSTPVLKSTDGGQSFTVVRAASNVNLNGYDENSGGQGNYNFGISVNPNNINHVMLVGHLIWKSTNGGANWTKMSTDWAHQVHTDMRQIPFSPFVANELYDINDGGIWRSWDNGDSWLPICNGLVGTESYIGSQSPVKKEAVSIGAQDNGEFVYMDGIWYINGGGDYHSNIIHDNISANYYYDLSGGGRRRGLPLGPDYSLNLPFDAGNGQSVFSAFPLSNTQVAFLGYKDVFRSANITNNPPTWTQITSFNRQVKAVASSPSDANVLYVVTDDGKVRRSDNALAGSPTFVTYNTPSATNVTASIVVLKSNTDIVYMVCNNKVYRSANKGANWTDVTGTLPNVNYHKILQDVYSNAEAVYLAGYNSVFYKDNTLTNWANFSKGLPSVVNFYRFYMYNDGTNNSELTFISAGRGVWHTGLYGKNPVLRTPENPENAIAGIVYNAYEGAWSTLPNFNSITAVKTGATDIPSLSVGTRTDNIALTFDGYIDVPSDGKYTFFTNSDDGTQFFIGTEMVINNDGVHGDQERSGYMWLKKGKHKFTLTYFQGTGGRSLSFSWQGPGIAKQLVPAEVLYRLSPMSTCPGNGSIAVERWNGIGGTNITNIPTGNTPSATYTLPNFEAKTDDGDNYGARYRGYICPPYTGNYVFYVASDDNSELWLSTTGDPANKVRIAYLNGSVNQRNWYANASQKSVKILLKAGQKYYVEALHKEGGGGDHFAVAWTLPSGEFQAPLPGKHVSPFVNNTFPTISLTAPANNSAFISGAAINLTATATDAGGSVSKVEFYADDIKIAEDNSSPYSYSWTGVSAGTYVITARAIDNLGAVTVSNANTVTIVDLRVPENPALTKSNIDYKYYEYTGDWSVLPNYVGLTPSKTGINPQMNYAIRNRDDHYGIVYSGFIDVPQDGIYTFYTNSDDGTKLYFGNKLLINNDGIHGSVEKSGIIGLKQGKHAITLEYFQNTGGQGLMVSYSGPSIAKQEIPANVLYRQIFSNNPPVITVTSNTTTGNAPATFTLTATASDNDGTIAKIELYSGTTLLGQSATSPYVFTYNNVAVGTYVITAKAYDDNNAVTTSTSVTLTVGSNQAPTVSITAPANNASYMAPASITLSATAADADGTITKVEFYNGTTLLGTSTTSPYSFNWTNVVAGTYSITAKAYDNSGLTKTSTAITVKVNANQAPTVSITAPANSSTYVAPASFTISATAADPDGSVAKVEFYNGTTLLGTSTTSPYSYNWTNVGAGIYTITAKAYDNLSLVTTSTPITVQVNGNQNPVVSITSPANNAVFTSAANIVLNATATDVDGTIAKVEFYNGSILLSTDNSSPYSFSWNGVVAGTYSITAKATDDKNGTTTSAVITVVVNNPNQAPTVSITGPANNAIYVASADINLMVNATDADGTISKVEFYNGTSLIGTSSSSPFTFNWLNVGVGTYTVSAKAYDNLGLSATSATITVKVNPNQTPTVTLTATSTVPNTVTISVNASDGDGSITKVEYYDGTTKIGELTSQPYTFTWTNAPAGTHTITAVAIDDKGGATISSPISVTVKDPNQAPVVTITAPLNNAVLISPATFIVEANATDADGVITKVEFYNGSIKIGEDLIAPYTYTASNVAQGTYTITVKAYDEKNLVTTSAPVNVVVAENKLPYVVINSPLEGSSFMEPTSILIEANASDADGTVQKVEFYYGLTKIGEDNTYPYSIQWNNVTKGIYTITAKAFDNQNASSVSQGVDVEVKKVTTGTVDSTFNQQMFTVYPNPVYSETTVQFALNNKANVQFILYDLKGNLLKEIPSTSYENGNYQVKLDVSELADATYILKTVVNNKIYSTQLFKGSKPKNSRKELSKR